MKKLILVSVCAVALIQGCSKPSPDAPEKVALLGNAKSPELVKPSVVAQKSADVHRADKSTPLTQYQELSSGKQLMFSYLSVSTMPVNYEKVAYSISSEFQRENDEFKKRDIINSLKPGIDNEITKAKSVKYYFMRLNSNLEKYDFESKSFKNVIFSEAETSHFFNDNRDFTLKFSNNSDFSKLNISDEQLARTIETYRAKYDVNMVVYFFINDTELGTSNVKAEITKLQLTDRKGNVLTEI